MKSERPPHMFEEVGQYEKPPLPAFGPADDYSAIERHGITRRSKLARTIIGLGLRAVRYPTFHKTLPESYEHLSRIINWRAGQTCAPAYSATVVLADDPRGALPPLERAATLVLAAQVLCRDTMAGRLTPDMLKGKPLEMGEYPNLWATHYTLVAKRLQLAKSPVCNKIAVIVARRVFVLDLGESENVSVKTVVAALDTIVSRAKALRSLRDDETAGVLGAANQSVFMKGLRALESTSENAKASKAIRECFTVLSLDLETQASTIAEQGREAQIGNPGNRWYSASTQLVVFGNGKAAGVFAFSAYLDGNVMMRSAAELYRRAVVLDTTKAASQKPLSDAVELKWSFPKTLARKAWLDVAKIRDPQAVTFEIEIGRRSFGNVDPVGAFVLAVALAVREVTGELPTILQLLTVSKHRYGSVGMAAVATDEVRRFVDSLNGGNVSDGDLRELLDSAIASQVREQRAERATMSLHWAIEFFLRSQRGFEKAYCIAVTAATLIALKLTGNLPEKRIALSHPEIYPELPLVGRPGVRLPYMNPFAAHYQIYEDMTRFTIMAGTKFKPTNATLATAIGKALRKISSIARTTSEASQTRGHAQSALRV